MFKPIMKEVLFEFSLFRSNLLNSSVRLEVHSCLCGVHTTLFKHLKERVTKFHFIGSKE